MLSFATKWSVVEESWLLRQYSFTSWVTVDSLLVSFITNYINKSNDSQFSYLKLGLTIPSLLFVRIKLDNTYEMTWYLSHVVVPHGLCFLCTHLLFHLKIQALSCIEWDQGMEDMLNVPLNSSNFSIKKKS